MRVWGVGRGGKWKERTTLVETLKEAKALRAESATRQFPEGSMRLEDGMGDWPTVRDSVQRRLPRL